MTVNELLQQAGISHAIYLERLKTGEVQRILGVLNEIDAELVAALSGRAESFSRTRLEALLRTVRDIQSRATARFEALLSGTVRDTAVYEASYQLRKIDEVLPIQWDIVTPTPETLHAAVFETPMRGALLSEHMQRYGDRKGRLISDAIRNGIWEGESVQTIMRRIRGTQAQRHRNGILEVSRREAEALVRTAVSHAVTTARESTFQQNDDLISGVTYVATLDSNTTLICAGLDGKDFPIGEGPRPPQHWKCRSTTVPAIKSWRQLGINLAEAPAGTRASMNGQVPETVTFGTWLKRQPAGVQREVLGQRRYELFRDGLQIDRFVKDGRVLTLDELARLDAA